MSDHKPPDPDRLTPALRAESERLRALSPDDRTRLGDAFPALAGRTATLLWVAAEEITRMRAEREAINRRLDDMEAQHRRDGTYPQGIGVFSWLRAEFDAAASKAAGFAPIEGSEAAR